MPRQIEILQNSYFWEALEKNKKCFKFLIHDRIYFLFWYFCVKQKLAKLQGRKVVPVMAQIFYPFLLSVFTVIHDYPIRMRIHRRRNEICRIFIFIYFIFIFGSFFAEIFGQGQKEFSSCHKLKCSSHYIIETW